LDTVEEVLHRFCVHVTATYQYARTSSATTSAGVGILPQVSPRGTPFFLIASSKNALQPGGSGTLSYEFACQRGGKTLVAETKSQHAGAAWTVLLDRYNLGVTALPSVELFDKSWGRPPILHAPNVLPVGAEVALGQYEAKPGKGTGLSVRVGSISKSAELATGGTYRIAWKAPCRVIQGAPLAVLDVVSGHAALFAMCSSSSVGRSTEAEAIPLPYLIAAVKAQRPPAF